MLAFPGLLVILCRRRDINAEKPALQISIWILAFFMMLRNPSVGVDTKFYDYIFEQFREIPFRDVFTARLYAVSSLSWGIDFEPGFRLMNKVLSLFFADGQAIIVFSSILIMILLYVFIKNESPLAMLSVWLYITLGYFQTEMNVSRNAMGILICLLALPLIEQKKWRAYIFLVLLGASLHQTVLFFLPVYLLLSRVPLTWKRSVLFMGGSLVLGLNFDWIRGTLQRMLPGRYARYLTKGNSRAESILVCVLLLGLTCMVLVQMTKEERKRAMACLQTGFWMLTLTVCFFWVGISFTAGARAAALFSLYMIVFLPKLISIISSKSRKYLVVSEMVIICFLQYILRMQINNIGGTMPYLFFWQRVLQ